MTTPPNVPVELQIWDAEACAAYMGCSKTHFLQSIQYANGFPAPIPREPYTHGGKQRTPESRWRAREVIAYGLGEEFPQPARNSQKAA